MTEESDSRFVTGLVTVDGCPTMVNEQDIFLVLT